MNFFDVACEDLFRPLNRIWRRCAAALRCPALPWMESAPSGFRERAW